jgi:hypothetical protein
VNRKSGIGVGQALEDVFMWRTPGNCWSSWLPTFTFYNHWSSVKLM